MKESLEDNWHDILCKAMRGLKLDVSLLTKRSDLNEASIHSLVEQAILNEETLVAIAPILNLNPKALLAVIQKPYCYNIPELPKNFQNFTTSYHGIEVHSYLLWSNQNKKAVAFDTGTDLAPLLQQLKEYQLHLSAIFLTHAHRDHVDQLKTLINKTGAPAWIDQHDLITSTQPLPLNYRYQLDNTITIEARPTPGHSAGGTTYVIQGPSPILAIVGDAIFARSVGGIPPNSYEAALKAIKEKVFSLPENTIIAPGHGPLTTVHDEKTQNPFFATS